MDWHDWHNHYDDANSPMGRRLGEVQKQIKMCLDQAPDGSIQVISVCAGQGRDLLVVLRHHDRRNDVSALLIDIEGKNTRAIADAAQKLRLESIRGLTADASEMDNYESMAPADLVLMCGVFGNIPDEDIRHTISLSRQLCDHGGRLIWTRHRREPDMVPQICEWFEAEGFEKEVPAREGEDYGVVTHRYLGTPQPLTRGVRMFEFVGYKSLRET